ncbi:MAG: tetratricopeptide repeat protein, partial [Proteobacteria bacterium]|nr:tetratricopeptide repeat protein [Pseudomonadota bacterium]
GNKLNTMDRVFQAGCLYETGHPGLGHSILYKLVRGERAPAWIALVYARRESERRPKVVRALLEEVLARDSDQPMVLALLARLDVAAGLPEKALERLNQAIAAGPVAADVMFERARILATRGDLPGAQSDALQAFSVQPALPGLSALLIRIYSAQGQIDEAIASFEEANAVGALEPPARMLLARMHIATSNRRRALELLEELLAENDALAGAKNDLAYLLALDSVDLDRALRLGQEAQRALPRISQVADTLGFVYLKKGLHEPALEQFRYAVKLGSEHDGVQPVYHYHAGRALQELGRTEEAATQFEEALALDANYEDAAAALRAAKPDASDELTSAASS